MAGRMALATDFNGPRPGDSSGATNQIDLPRIEPPRLPSIRVAGHHLVTPGERLLHADVRSCGGIPGGIRCLTRSQQCFRRHASPIRAFATDPFTFDNGDSRTFPC
jgi:hypothetical protein